MKPGRKAVLFSGMRMSSVAALIFALFPLHAAEAVRATNCASSQRILFSCSTGTKTISVCGSTDWSANSGLLQYRFGRPVAVEFSYPPAGADWRSIVRGGTLMFSGGGGAFLSFTKVPYRYTVYSATGQGWGSKAGVVVEKDGKRIASLACKGNVTSELGPDLFSKAAIEVADDSFKLP